MASSLDMVVTAEGVENVDQARALLALGCGRLQGFLFSRPVACSEVPELLCRRWTVETSAESAIRPVVPSRPRV